MSYENPKTLAEDLAQKAMALFIPESNVDDDDPGGQYSYKQAIREFQKVINKWRRQSPAPPIEEK